MEDYNINLFRSLTIFYLIQLSSYTKPLIGKQLKELLSENRIAQHIVNYCLLLVIFLVIYPKNLGKNILYSFFAYILFIITTKMELHMNLIVLLLLLGGFIYETNYSNKKDRILKDNEIEFNLKNNIFDKLFKNNMIFFIFFIIISTLFMTLYLNKKREQYGGSYDTLNFFIY
jgi:hypothetical protein